ncbi:ribosomal protein L14 [Neorickettsia helminthoeca str. Oregon]|uniref:Large ribosomal subunit protein uL14 n=1 Tax=Neorickettsia helminthoeca str. Oregon TaxID=1286528 RepID=X5HJG2_9RICK|nr:50S ribosomal protein L14 [Neorickettsia helminthoeca]AHX11219.1 ribosomal protein L14 [Neorickettsia helminthoeca str. Oregon]
MIKKETILDVADNSGAKKVLCIGISGSRRTASIGDVIVVSVKKCAPSGKVSAGSIYRAVVVRVKKRLPSSVVVFSDNAVVLLNQQNEMIGTRVFGPTDSLLRKNRGFAKISSLSQEVFQ